MPQEPSSIAVDTSSAPAGLYRRVLGAGLVTVVGRIGGIGLTVLLNTWLARQLGPALFGIYCVIVSACIIISTAALFGLNRALLRYVAEALARGDSSQARALVRRGMLWCAGTTGVAAVVFLALWPLAGVPWLQLPPSLRLAGWSAAWMTLLTAHQLIGETLRGFHEIRLSTLLSGQAGGPLANALFLVGLALAAQASPLHLEAVFAIAACSYLAVLPLAVWGLRWTIARAEQKEPDRTGEPWQPSSGAGVPTRELLFTCLGLLLSQFLGVLVVQGDMWIAAATLDRQQVGHYSAARRLMQLVVLPLYLVNLSVVSSVPDLYVRKQFAALEHLLRRGTTVAFLPALAAILLIGLFPGYLLRLVFGAEYGAAAPVVLIMTAGGVITAWSGPAFLVLMMTGQQRLNVLANTLALFLLVTAGPVAAVMFGSVGLGSVGSAVLTCQAVMTWYFVRTRLGIRTDPCFRRPRTLLRERTYQ